MIKYQAWHIKQQKMYRVVALYLGEKEQLVTLKNEDTAFHTFPLAEVVLREFINRTSKHHAEIYTGDIVAYGNNRGLIKDIWTYQWLQTEVEDGTITDDILDRFKHLSEMTGLELTEIIGNIYEDPKLAGSAGVA